MGYVNPEVPNHINEAIAKQDLVVDTLTNSLYRIMTIIGEPEGKKRMLDSIIKKQSAAERLAEQIRSEFDLKPAFKIARMNLWRETKFPT